MFILTLIKIFSPVWIDKMNEPSTVWYLVAGEVLAIDTPMFVVMVWYLSTMFRVDRNRIMW